MGTRNTPDRTLSVTHRLDTVDGPMSDSQDRTGHLHPSIKRLRNARDEATDRGDEPGETHESVRRGVPKEPISTAWPAWAVVDWEELDRQSGQSKLRDLSDIAVAVAPARTETHEREPIVDVSTTSEGSETSERERSAPEPLFRPQVELEPSPHPDSALTLPPTRLGELLQEAAYAAQEARERAARAEGEAQVLRYELEREREERERLTMELARRRRWFTRRGE